MPDRHSVGQTRRASPNRCRLARAAPGGIPAGIEPRDIATGTRMAVPAIYLANAAITAAISGGAVTYWLVSARRSMGAAVDRARAEADQITRQAEREAETLRKEAALEARERAHELASSGGSRGTRPAAGNHQPRTIARRQDARARGSAGRDRPDRERSSRS